MYTNKMYYLILPTIKVKQNIPSIWKCEYFNERKYSRSQLISLKFSIRLAVANREKLYVDSGEQKYHVLRHKIKYTLYMSEALAREYYKNKTFKLIVYFAIFLKKWHFLRNENIMVVRRSLAALARAYIKIKYFFYNYDVQCTFLSSTLRNRAKSLPK